MKTIESQTGGEKDWCPTVTTPTHAHSYGQTNPELSGTQVSNQEDCPTMKRDAHWTGGLEVLSFSHIPLNIVRG